MSGKILEIQDIKKSFGKKEVHRGISFSLHKGESLGLLGSSGTGKSVLLRSIVGLEFIDSGKVLFQDQEIQDLKEEDYFKVRTQISYSFQSGALFDSLNVFDNLAYPLYEHTDLPYEEIVKKVITALDFVDLENSESLMPSDLSGGMQKRVGMARSLILEPQIILYDEPTAGLDPINTQRIVKVMKRFKAMGQSSIFVTHDIPSAFEICDRIVMINEGKVVFNGTTEEFKNSDDPFINSFIQKEGNYVQETR
ncbi:MAG: ABC transporter ATP-binding protein [Bacteriovoracaceae bacterium]